MAVIVGFVLWASLLYVALEEPSEGLQCAGHKAERLGALRTFSGGAGALRRVQGGQLDSARDNIHRFHDSDVERCRQAACPEMTDSIAARLRIRQLCHLDFVLDSALQHVACSVLSALKQCLGVVLQRFLENSAFQREMTDTCLGLASPCGEPAVFLKSLAFRGEEDHENMQEARETLSFLLLTSCTLHPKPLLDM